MIRPVRRGGRGARVLAAVAAAAGLSLWIGAAGCSAPDPLARIDAALAAGDAQGAYRQALALTQTDAHAGDAAAWLALARTCRATMRTSRGVEAVARTIELAPDDARAYRLSAVLDQDRRRNVAAVESARRATELAPDDAAGYALLGGLLLGGGMVGTADYAGSEAAFRAALERDPACLPARYGLGKTLVLAGRHAEGAAELDAYLAERPLHGDAYYHRGLARMRTRDFDGAESDFRRASALPPRPHQAFFNLARVLQMNGKKEEAEEMRARYLALRPLQMDAETLEMRYHSRSDNLQNALDVAARLAEAQRFTPAKTILESLALDNPDLPRPLLMLAEVAVLDGDAARAAWAADRAIEVTGGSAAAHHFRARAAALAGDPETGAEHALGALEQEPASVEYRLSLGNLLLSAGQNDEAARVFAEGRRHAPQDVRFVAGQGRALAAAGRGAEAEPLLNTALRVRPRSADWLTHRGLARQAQGDTAGAEEDFRRAAAVAPQFGAAYDSLAELLRQTGRKEEAREFEDRGRMIRDRERAIRDARAAFHRNAADAEAASVLAGLLREAGKDAEADAVEGRSAALREEHL